MTKNSFFLLFSNCILVKGISRSTICDLQKGFYIFIPNSVADILFELEKSSISKVLEKMEVTSDVLDKYFKYLIENDLGHFCDDLKKFPKINPHFRSPNKIEDCIIELSILNHKNIDKILKTLTNLGCASLELRAFDDFSLKKISRILDLLQSTQIRNVDLYLKYSKRNKPDVFDEFLNRHQIIGLLVIHSFDKRIPVNAESRVVFTTQEITSSNCCGNISKEHFVVNLNFYLEGLKHNTCLNRKFSISADGSIRNCPSLTKNYGNILDANIEATLDSKDFRKLWGINKSKINACKDCEFRIICSDCRAFVKGNYAKPKNCKYDPYSMSYTES